MKISLWKLISSAFFTIVLLVVYAAALAGATFLEKGYGTLMAKTWVYYSPLFILWQFLMVVNFIAMAIRFHLFRWRKWGFVLTHIAFIVILSGAFISHVLAVDGFVHIREGESIVRERFAGACGWGDSRGAGVHEQCARRERLSFFSSLL